MKKRISAVVLAMVMILTTALPIYAYGVNPSDYPYVDENGIYHRSSASGSAGGKELTFNTDYDKMVDYFRNAMMNHESSITYMFATTDEKYQYSYENNQSAEQAKNAAIRLLNDVLYDAYTKDTANPKNAAGGDYLFKSIEDINNFNYGYYLSKDDTPKEGNQRYYTFKLTIGKILYFTTVAQEQYIQKIAKEFSKKYIPEGASDYLKVKTIYDFIVRNTTYDLDVFNGDYKFGSPRYNISHSAYGALVGSLIESGKNESEFDMESKKTITNQNVIVKANQGLAVCEGYSKLFYYLCVLNGVPCRIVDGDYLEEAQKPSDPHEWNYVWLDDGCGDGYKWFQVDTTFASQRSYKEIDINSYDYFLCGRENIHYNVKNHQQPYTMKQGLEVGREQHYDWWDLNASPSYVASYKDYQIKKVHFDKSSADAFNDGYLVKRSTLYPGESTVKVAFVYTVNGHPYELKVDDDNNFVICDEVQGFVYNGQDSSVYEVVLPYVVDREYTRLEKGNPKDSGEYTVVIEGDDNTTVEFPFYIQKLNMDNGSAENYDANIQNSASYTGSEIIPQVYISDRYNNKLEKNKDYTVTAYSDPNHTQKTEINDIGTYYIDINYEISRNYSGHYYLTFTVGKIDLEKIFLEKIFVNGCYPFQYLPDYYLNHYGIKTAADYYTLGAVNQKIGKYNLKVGTDYSVISNGTLNYGDSGTLTFTGLKNSNYVKEGTVATAEYSVNKKFDISNFNNGTADTGTKNVYYYTGSAIKPAKFDFLDERLKQGKDYKIVSYSNNINAGKASVTIEGINGCSGRATMYFVINKTSLSKASVSAKTVNGNVTYTVKYNGKTLVKNKDFKESLSSAGSSYKIVLTGMNNFNGSTAINVNKKLVKPTSKGNYIKLSASSYTYNGKAKQPTVKVYNKSKQAINSYYYTVSYSSNKSVGTAKAKITFRNGYKGSITKTFKINPKGTSLSSVKAKKKGFTVKWKKQSTQTTGYQIQYSTSSKFKSAKTVTVSKNKTTSKTVSKLKAKKKYYVRIRTYKKVGSKKYYSSWSKAKTVKTKK